MVTMQMPTQHTKYNGVNMVPCRAYTSSQKLFLSSLHPPYSIIIIIYIQSSINTLNTIPALKKKSSQPASFFASQLSINSMFREMG